MTFRHLEIFMSVYQNQSITKASKELHISQPSVSLAIKELEKKYQTPLFDRMNRQIYPTEKAHLLYNHSLQILSSLENMENEMYEDHLENISFGCSVTMAQVFLPHLLKKLKKLYPTIHFHIIVNNLEYIENLLLKNELDFALIELVKQNDGFTILPYSLVKEANEVSYLKSNDFQIQRTYHIVMHKDKKLLPLYQEIFELIKKE